MFNPQKYRNWINEIVETGQSTETTPPPPTEAPVTYIDHQFVVDLLEGISGDVNCIHPRKGQHLSNKTQRMRIKKDAIKMAVQNILIGDTFMPRCKYKSIPFLHLNNCFSMFKQQRRWNH